MLVLDVGPEDPNPVIGPANFLLGFITFERAKGKISENESRPRGRRDITVGTLSDPMNVVFIGYYADLDFLRQIHLEKGGKDGSNQFLRRDHSHEPVC